MPPKKDKHAEKKTIHKEKTILKEVLTCVSTYIKNKIRM